MDSPHYHLYLKHPIPTGSKNKSKRGLRKLFTFPIMRPLNQDETKIFKEIILFSGGGGGGTRVVTKGDRKCTLSQHWSI